MVIFYVSKASSLSIEDTNCMMKDLKQLLIFSGLLQKVKLENEFVLNNSFK